MTYQMLAVDFDLRMARHFVVVAEEGSFSRAAERLYVSQPALSKQIRALERTVGFNTRFIDRTRRPWQLTPEGEQFLEVCKDLLERMDALLDIRN